MMAAPPHDSTTDANAGRCEPPIPAATRHAEFYFTDEMTVFQVENRLFRVHRHFLTENSLIFSSMFSLPQGDQQVSSTPAEGTSDANPIHLSGVTVLEFETLLRFFFKGSTLPQESWMTLLSIAHRYEFLDVRERAISEIYGPFRARLESWESISLAVKREKKIQQELQQHDYQLLISVAEKYDVPLCHIVPLLLPFVVREQPLTLREVLRFSALTLTRLANAREDFLRGGPKNPWERASMKPDVTPDAVKRIVYSIWEPELETDDSGSATRNEIPIF